MNHIAEQVLTEVLVRLPVKSLLRCQCVSKSWRAMIAHIIRHPCRREKQSKYYMILAELVLPERFDLWQHICHMPSGYFDGFKLERYEELLLHMNLLEKVRNRSHEKRYKPACAVRPIEMDGFIRYGPRYEIIYSTDDQCVQWRLNSLLERRRLRFENIRMFSTVDGCCLSIFVVHGWPADGVDSLREAVKEDVLKIWLWRQEWQEWQRLGDPSV